MRVLLAPLEFKGTLTARQAATAIARGIRRSQPGADLVMLPLADGGPGTLEAILGSCGGERRKAPAEDPLGRSVEADWALIRGRVAVVEMAAASGLWRVAKPDRRALRASTFGTGQLIRAGLEAGAEELLIGAGGSATTDGGAGALSALGARLLDASGIELPPGGGALRALERIDLAGLHGGLAKARVTVATDVIAPLLGPSGAARVFGPQKGASAQEVEALEQGLAQLSAVAARTAGRDLSVLPGGGAAGGLAFGLASLAGAVIRSGFDVVADLVGLERQLEAADLVITGEGQLDAQTSMGKGPWSLLLRARGAGKPVVMFAGRIAQTAAPLVGEFSEVIEATPQDADPPTGGQHAVEWLDAAAERWARGRRLF